MTGNFVLSLKQSKSIISLQNFLTNEVVWFLAGLVLFLAELVLPGLILMFFGIGAWITALCCLLFNIGINSQLLVFLITSVASLALLRKVIRKHYIPALTNNTGDLEEDYIGKTATAISDFDQNGKGKISFKGSSWDAVATEPVLEGQLVIITRFESILLFVKPVATSTTI